jgi:hypothetical protein
MQNSGVKCGGRCEVSATLASLAATGDQTQRGAETKVGFFAPAHSAYRPSPLANPSRHFPSGSSPKPATRWFPRQASFASRIVVNAQHPMKRIWPSPNPVARRLPPTRPLRGLCLGKSFSTAGSLAPTRSVWRPLPMAKPSSFLRFPTLEPRAELGCYFRSTRAGFSRCRARA